MPELIHRTEIIGEQWYDTSIVRTDGREEFREKPGFRDLHAIFVKGSEWGEVHVDEHNALDFPNGTINHLSKYTEEKTGIPETIAKGVIILGGLFVGAKLLHHLEDYR